MMTVCSVLDELSSKAVSAELRFAAPALDFALLEFGSDLFPQTVVPALLNMIYSVTDRRCSYLHFTESPPELIHHCGGVWHTCASLILAKRIMQVQNTHIQHTEQQTKSLFHCISGYINN